MAGPPTKIQVDPSDRPVARHSPASIPLHLQEKVHQDLLRDEALGTLGKVPHGKPTQCMVTTTKHNGTPRRIVDLLTLKKICKCTTFASETSIHLTHRISGHPWKMENVKWRYTRDARISVTWQ